MGSLSQDFHTKALGCPPHSLHSEGLLVQDGLNVHWPPELTAVSVFFLLLINAHVFCMKYFSELKLH